MTVPAGAAEGAVTGAASGAAVGAAVGAALDATVVYLKGESAQIGHAIEHVMGKAFNTQENRNEVGRYCEECKEDPAIERGTKNSKGDYTFKQLVERVKEFFGKSDE